jgi:glyoxylase-like metal-dependent hydrolase (beta-lactamase superfamily II)
VARGVWRVTTPIPGRPREVHAYLAELEGGGGWMLVDGGVGTGDAWAALDAGVREAAGGWSAVRVLAVTHMHVDHVGLAARAKAVSGAPLAMGRLDAERMAHAAAHPDDEAAYRAALLRGCGAPDDFAHAVEGARREAQAAAPPVEVDAVLDGEEGELPGAPGWRFLWTPGHTAGHVSLVRDADRVVIAGDAVMARITPTLGVNRQRPDPVGDYLGALDRLEALAPSLLLAGHGEPLEESDAAARIRELRAAALAETESVAALLDAGGATTWEVVARRYAGRDLPAGATMLALRETRAHLDRLEAAGRARRAASEAGADTFFPVP